MFVVDLAMAAAYLVSSFFLSTASEAFWDSPCLSYATVIAVSAFDYCSLAAAIAFFNAATTSARLPSALPAASNAVCSLLAASLVSESSDYHLANLVALNAASN